MPTKVNLASKPFSNRSLPWAVTALVILVSLVSLVLIVRANGKTRARASVVQNELNNLVQQEQQLRKQAQEVKNSLTPDQLQTLAAAHTLIDRKRFSWSRLLADFESALPSNVRVSRIAVRDVATQGDSTIATLELAVFTKDPATITQMISDMHKQGIFQLVLRTQNLAKGRGEQGSEYEFDVIYRARAGYAAAESVAGVNNPQDTSEASR